jgi:GTP-binding protein Era
MKNGIVLLIGRPNVGKSTLLNNLIGQKVAITSPKPQTTRFPIRAFYQDERGQIIFIDTPGVFRKAKDTLSKKINFRAAKAYSEDIDLVVYIVDPTRKRDFEEAKILGIVRKIDKPKILVINKIDQKLTYLPHYKFLEEEFKEIVSVSASEKKNLKALLEKIFDYLPEKKEPLIDTKNFPFPAMNIDSKTFVAEIIREKVFLQTRHEVPYRTMVLVDEIIERNDKLSYIKARILTIDDRYKKILIGEGGRKIKVIGSMARKELELATGRKIYLDLTVETDSHWPEIYYS